MPITVDLTPQTQPTVRASGTLPWRISATPAAIAFDPAVQPPATASGTLDLEVFTGPIVALIPAVQPPVTVSGTLPLHVAPRPTAIDFAPLVQPRVEASGALPLRIAPRPVLVDMTPAFVSLQATGTLPLQFYPRPTAVRFNPFAQALQATGRQDIRVYPSILDVPSVIDETIQQLRDYCPLLAGRVAGAANFANGLQNYNANMPLPAAYVIPLSEEAEPNQVMIGLIQKVHRTIGVVVEFDATADRRGQVPAMHFDAMEAGILRALLNWPPTWCRTPNNQGFQLSGGRTLDLDRARLFYQWEFGLDWQIDDAQDGWQPLGDPLEFIELHVHKAPLSGHPWPAAVMRVNMQPPTVWDDPRRPTQWDDTRTVWLA
jgi:hypothetical protein